MKQVMLGPGAAPGAKGVLACSYSLALGSAAASRMGCSFMARPMDPEIFSLRMKKACWAPSLPFTLRGLCSRIMSCCWDNHTNLEGKVSVPLCWLRSDGPLEIPVNMKATRRTGISLIFLPVSSPPHNCTKLAPLMVSVRSAFSAGLPLDREPCPGRRSRVHSSLSMTNTTTDCAACVIRR